MLTIKKEAFAEEYVANSGNASAAYRHAYNTHAAPHTIAVEASRLLTDPDVALRVSALREAVSAHSTLTAADVVSQLQEIHHIAMEQNKYGTAIRALEVMGRMMGAFDGVRVG